MHVSVLVTFFDGWRVPQIRRGIAKRKKSRQKNSRKNSKRIQKTILKKGLKNSEKIVVNPAQVLPFLLKWENRKQEFNRFSTA